MSVVVQKSSPSEMSAVKSVLSAVAAFFSSIVAAGAVAQAVENRRQPEEAHLRALGLEGVRFKQYY